MGTKLTGRSQEATPVIGVTRKVNGYFIGTLKDKGREVKLRRGKAMVYEFAVQDTDFDIQIKNASGEYVNHDVASGDKVSIFAPIVLRDALQLADIGDLITIKYLGMKPGKNGDFHDFEVEKA